MCIGKKKRKFFEKLYILENKKQTTVLAQAKLNFHGKINFIDSLYLCVCVCVCSLTKPTKLQYFNFEKKIFI